MSNIQLIKPGASYAHARIIEGKPVTLGGVGSRNPQTNTVPGITRDEDGAVTGYDITVEFNQCVDNVRAILAQLGLSLENLADVQVFLTDIADVPAFNTAWDAVFKGSPKLPTRTTREVSALPTYGDTSIHIELTCTADMPLDHVPPEL